MVRYGDKSQFSINTGTQIIQGLNVKFLCIVNFTALALAISIKSSFAEVITCEIDGSGYFSAKISWSTTSNSAEYENDIVGKVLGSISGNRPHSSDGPKLNFTFAVRGEAFGYDEIEYMIFPNGPDSYRAAGNGYKWINGRRLLSVSMGNDVAKCNNKIAAAPMSETQKNATTFEQFLNDQCGIFANQKDLTSQDIDSAQKCLDQYHNDFRILRSCSEKLKIDKLTNSVFERAQTLAFSPAKYKNKTTDRFVEWDLDEDWYLAKAGYLKASRDWNETLDEIQQCMTDSFATHNEIFFKRDFTTYLASVNDAISGIEACPTSEFRCIYEYSISIIDAQSRLNKYWSNDQPRSKKSKKKQR